MLYTFIYTSNDVTELDTIKVLSHISFINKARQSQSSALAHWEVQLDL